MYVCIYIYIPPSSFGFLFFSSPFALCRFKPTPMFSLFYFLAIFIAREKMILAQVSTNLRKWLPPEVKAWPSLFDCGGNSEEKIQITGEIRKQARRKRQERKKGSFAKRIRLRKNDNICESRKHGKSTQKKKKKQFIQYNSPFNLVFDLFQPIPVQASF